MSGDGNSVSIKLAEVEALLDRYSTRSHHVMKCLTALKHSVLNSDARLARLDAPQESHIRDAEDEINDHAERLDNLLKDMVNSPNCDRMVQEERVDYSRRRLDALGQTIAAVKDEYRILTSRFDKSHEIVRKLRNGVIHTVWIHKKDHRGLAKYLADYERGTHTFPVIATVNLDEPDEHKVIALKSDILALVWKEKETECEWPSELEYYTFAVPPRTYRRGPQPLKGDLELTQYCVNPDKVWQFPVNGLVSVLDV